MLQSWFNRVRAARLWVSAVDSCSKERFSDAFQAIESIEKIIPPSNGSKADEFDPRLPLLKALVLIKLDRTEEALRLIKGLDQVLRRSTIAQLKYLRGYMSLLMQTVKYYNRFAAIDPELEPLLRLNLEDIDLDKVPSHIKRIFPIPSHSKWRE